MLLARRRPRPILEENFVSEPWACVPLARELSPVDARAFDLAAEKASEFGTVGLDAASLVRIAISRGELGEGGVLERVVAELLFMDHRRLGFFRELDPARFTSDGPPEPDCVILSAWAWELDRLKMLVILDMARVSVKLDAEEEPRVERRDNGTGVVSGSPAPEGVVRMALS